jgi:hypothetical protein
MKKEEQSLSNLRIISIVSLCLFVSAFFILFHVRPIRKEFIIEYGSEISGNPEDYLTGLRGIVDRFNVDLNGLNSKSEPGEYDISAKLLFRKISLKLLVEDTIAPSVKYKRKLPVFNVDDVYYGDYLVEDAFDMCSDLQYKYVNTLKDESIHLLDDGERIYFSSTGDYIVGVMVSDASGNVTKENLNISVDKAPVINGAKDLYLATGTEIDLAGLTAYDAKDGDVSDRIKVGISSFYKDNPGIYTVSFTAEDSDGLVGRESVKAYVFDKYTLQDLYNRGAISDDFNVMGLINPYDSGYNEEQDLNTAIEDIKPALVEVFHSTGTGWTRGSGFILHIDEEEIIICTNRHVTNGKKNFTITFFDGSKAKATLISEQKKPDMAFIKINKDYINDELLKRIKTVHINKSYYDDLMNVPTFDVGYYSIDSNGDLFKTARGNIVFKSGVMSDYFAGFDYPVTRVTTEFAKGVSGSPIIDSHGNLICMATFMYINGNSKEYYGVSLSDILDYYESVFGERLEYY